MTWRQDAEKRRFYEEVAKPSNRKRVYCPVCKEPFLDEEKYKQHYKSNHPLPKTIRTGRQFVLFGRGAALP